MQWSMGKGQEWRKRGNASSRKSGYVCTSYTSNKNWQIRHQNNPHWKRSAWTHGIGLTQSILSFPKHPRKKVCCKLKLRSERNGEGSCPSALGGKKSLKRLGKTFSAQKHHIEGRNRGDAPSHRPHKQQMASARNFIAETRRSANG